MPEHFVTDLLLAAAGGILGASIGGVAAFILCGSVALAGSAMSVVMPSSVFGPALAWGPLFGPHVAFSGGVAAAAFAARLGKLDSGRNIVSPLLPLRSPGVLVTGMVFGLAGHVLKSSFDALPAWGGVPLVNSIAVTVAISGILARIAFGLQAGPRTGEVASSAAAQWHPWRHSRSSLWVVMIVLGFLASAWGWKFPHLLGVPTALAAASILASLAGIQLPVWIHIAWAGEYAAAITGDPAAGLAYSLAAGLVAEIAARLLLIGKPTHIDPPALALAVLSPALPALHGAYPLPGISPLAITAAVLISFLGLTLGLKEDAMPALPGTSTSQ